MTTNSDEYNGKPSRCEKRLPTYLPVPVQAGSLDSIMSSILLQFPSPPRRSYLSVFEQDGQMKDAPDTLPISSPPDYPEVSLQSESVSRSNTHCENAQLAFLSHGQGSWKQALHALQNGGFLEFLNELSNSEAEVPVLISSSCKYGLSLFKRLMEFKSSFYPTSSLSETELLSKYTHVSNWNKSPIQALAWHPHVAKVAVVLRDNSVHIHSSRVTLSPVLKHRLQKQVADVAWQPLSSSVLAVACQSCVLIWHVEPTSLAVRPSSSSVQILQYNDHSPITSLCWMPSGNSLLSASPKHNLVMVWDVPKEQGIPLRCDRGVPLMCASPDGSKLFTGSLSPLFRMWETHRWNSEVWSELSGRCKAACWSPDGSVLIFAMEKDSALYAIRFTSNTTADEDQGHVSAVGHSVILADVSQVSVSVGSDADIRAGGEVHTIVWDQTGERLAVMFEANELDHNHLIAVFKVTIHPVLELLPGGFIKGRSGESAHHIAFAPNFDRGALLSVIWSSGRVGYVPMYFIPAHRIQNHQHQQAEQQDNWRWYPPSPLMSPRDRV